MNILIAKKLLLLKDKNEISNFVATNQINIFEDLYQKEHIICASIIRGNNELSDYLFNQYLINNESLKDVQSFNGQNLLILALKHESPIYENIKNSSPLWDVLSTNILNTSFNDLYTQHHIQSSQLADLLSIRNPDIHNSGLVKYIHDLKNIDYLEIIKPLHRNKPTVLLRILSTLNSEQLDFLLSNNEDFFNIIEQQLKDNHKDDNSQTLIKYVADNKDTNAINIIFKHFKNTHQAALLESLINQDYYLDSALFQLIREQNPNTHHIFKEMSQYVVNLKDPVNEESIEIFNIMNYAIHNKNYSLINKLLDDANNAIDTQDYQNTAIKTLDFTNKLNKHTLYILLESFNHKNETEFAICQKYLNTFSKIQKIPQYTPSLYSSYGFVKAKFESEYDRTPFYYSILNFTPSVTKHLEQIIDAYKHKNTNNEQLFTNIGSINNVFTAAIQNKQFLNDNIEFLTSKIEIPTIENSYKQNEITLDDIDDFPFNLEDEKSPLKYSVKTTPLYIYAAKNLKIKDLKILDHYIKSLSDLECMAALQTAFFYNSDIQVFEHITSKLNEKNTTTIIDDAKEKKIFLMNSLLNISSHHLIRKEFLNKTLGERNNASFISDKWEIDFDKIFGENQDAKYLSKIKNLQEKKDILTKYSILYKSKPSIQILTDMEEPKENKTDITQIKITQSQINQFLDNQAKKSRKSNIKNINIDYYKNIHTFVSKKISNLEKKELNFILGGLIKEESKENLIAIETILEHMYTNKELSDIGVLRFISEILIPKNQENNLTSITNSLTYLTYFLTSKSIIAQKTINILENLNTDDKNTAGLIIYQSFFSLCNQLNEYNNVQTQQGNNNDFLFDEIYKKIKKIIPLPKNTLNISIESPKSLNDEKTFTLINSEKIEEKEEETPRTTAQYIKHLVLTKILKVNKNNEKTSKLEILKNNPLNTLVASFWMRSLDDLSHSILIKNSPNNNILSDLIDNGFKIPNDMTEHFVNGTTHLGWQKNFHKKNYDILNSNNSILSTILKNTDFDNFSNQVGFLEKLLSLRVFVKSPKKEDDFFGQTHNYYIQDFLKTNLTKTNVDPRITNGLFNELNFITENSLNIIDIVKTDYLNRNELNKESTFDDYSMSADKLILDAVHQFFASKPTSPEHFSNTYFETEENYETLKNTHNHIIKNLQEKINPNLFIEIISYYILKPVLPENCYANFLHLLLSNPIIADTIKQNKDNLVPATKNLSSIINQHFEIPQLEPLSFADLFLFSLICTKSGSMNNKTNIEYNYEAIEQYLPLADITPTNQIAEQLKNLEAVMEVKSNPQSINNNDNEETIEVINKIYIKLEKKLLTENKKLITEKPRNTNKKRI